jgi:hypothetical protein
MSSHHAKLIRQIFQDPPTHSLHWRDVESLLRHVGAAVEPLSGARIKVTKQRFEAVLHRPHHGANEMDKQGLMALRGFLAHIGATPSQYEAGAGRSSGASSPPGHDRPGQPMVGRDEPQR